MGEVDRLKGLGFFTFLKGIPIILLKNISMISGLVNSITTIVEEAVLNKDI